VLHTKLDPPLALSSVEFPSQIIEGDALTEIFGAELTFTIKVALAEQPPAFVPVTEYVVVADGLTLILEDVAPLLQTKLDAPVAVNVVDPPAQIDEEDALIATLGEVLTATLTLETAEQPFALVPVTE